LYKESQGNISRNYRSGYNYVTIKKIKISGQVSEIFMKYPG